MSDDRRDPEAQLIQKAFAPLTLGAEGSFGLADDVAFITAGSSGLIVTQDQVIEGTHFLATDAIAMVAKRLVRRNLSDIIAKGGLPTAAFLSLAWPKSRPRAGIIEFASGLGEDLAGLCGTCPLLGGDTSTIDGPLVASLTLLARPTAATGGPVLRGGAQEGDVIAVTGVIGDAWLGLQARLGLLDRQKLTSCVAFATAPYPPALALAPLIGQYAHACLDVSDGLLLDARRLAQASGIGIELALERVPVSHEAAAYVAEDQIARTLMLASGGDDYQPLIAFAEADFGAFASRAHALGIRVTAIGRCVAGRGLKLSFEGEPVDLPATLGWEV
jgi:thiamine-monophosphate kinase